MSEKEKRPITLEDVEKHLNKQDAELKRGNRLAISMLGASVVFVALGLWIGNVIPSLIIIQGYCYVLALLGLGLMAWALCRKKS